jgi:hypothetical protein
MNTKFIKFTMTEKDVFNNKICFFYKIYNTWHRKGIVVELGKSRNVPHCPRSKFITAFSVFQIRCTFFLVVRAAELKHASKLMLESVGDEERRR